MCLLVVLEGREVKFSATSSPWEEPGLSRKIIQNYRKRNRAADDGEEKGIKKRENQSVA